MALAEAVVRWVVIGGLAATLLGCATAGKQDPDPVDATISDPPDAAVVVSYDARPIPDAAPGAPDARPPPDAYQPPDAVPPPPDAAAGGMCEGNNECIPSECCYILFCVPGDRLGALCIPN